jgi:cell division septation protein DedD
LQHAKPAPTPTAAASAAPVDKSSAPAKPSAKDAKKAAALAKKEKAAREKQAAAQAKTRQQEAKATATKPPAASPVPVASTEEKFLINVGLFADPNNARNAYVKLQDAGLPAVSQEVKSSKGPLTRVRVGPFETQTEADAAADKIRGLKLEAAVFKQ